MSVFLAVSDEAMGKNIFHYAGYVAPVAFWDQEFSPAWKQLVLEGQPQLDEFHMVELRRARWRDEHGVSPEDVERKIDVAVDLISKALASGSIHAVGSSIDNGQFEQHSDGVKVDLSMPGRARPKMAVDVLPFVSYLFTILNYVSKNFPEATQVNFLIEKKDELSLVVNELFETMPENLNAFGSSNCAKLMGELTQGDKQDVRLQAADLLCWHIQRKAAHSCDPSIGFSDVDRQRYSAINRGVTGNTWRSSDIEKFFVNARAATR